MSSIDDIIKVTGVYSAAVYAIIFTILLVVGYYNRCNELYNLCADKMDDNTASKAWFPFVNVIPMARAVNTSFLPAFISLIVFALCLVASAVLFLLKVLTLNLAIFIVLFTYVIHSVCHYLLLRKYMHTFFPQTSEFCIVACCFIPLFKLYIHTDIKK